MDQNEAGFGSIYIYIFRGCEARHPNAISVHSPAAVDNCELAWDNKASI